MMRYYGGKWNLADWIISHFPDHEIYVEPYGGAGSVLLKKNPVYSEIYNDLYGEVYNLFKVFRDNGRELIQKLRDTPYSRDEFELSYIPSNDETEQARRTVVRSYMGFGSSSLFKKSGFRGFARNSRSHPAQDWKNLPEGLDYIVDRLRGVVIENKPALDIIEKYDSPNTLFYIDPPYVQETRYGKYYEIEMEDSQHRELAERLGQLQGMVILSGYDCPLYRELFSSWKTINKSTYANGARKRVETIWLNEACKKSQSQFSLFHTTN